MLTEKLMDSSESPRVFAKDIIYYIAYAEPSGRTQNRSEGCPPEEEEEVINRINRIVRVKRLQYFFLKISFRGVCLCVLLAYIIIFYCFSCPSDRKLPRTTQRIWFTRNFDEYDKFYQLLIYHMTIVYQQPCTIS